MTDCYGGLLIYVATTLMLYSHELPEKPIMPLTHHGVFVHAHNLSCRLIYFPANKIQRAPVLLSFKNCASQAGFPKQTLGWQASRKAAKWSGSQLISAANGQNYMLQSDYILKGPFSFISR